MIMKTCTRCGLEKSIDCYTKRKNGVYAECKECWSIKSKLYYSQKREAISLRSRLYQQQNREVITARVAVRHEDNPDIRAKKARRYYQANRDKRYAYSAKYRASRQEATPSWVNNDVVLALYRIASELTNLGIPTHVDHIVPLNSDLVCGLNCEDNMQLLSKSDNLSKGNRHWPDMW